MARRGGGGVGCVQSERRPARRLRRCARGPGARAPALPPDPEGRRAGRGPGRMDRSSRGGRPRTPRLSWSPHRSPSNRPERVLTPEIDVIPRLDVIQTLRDSMGDPCVPTTQRHANRRRRDGSTKVKPRVRDRQGPERDVEEEVAMHAVLVTVTIESGHGEEAQTQLETNVIPRVKETAGVVSGYWTR